MEAGINHILLGKGTQAEPWNLTTPAGGSDYQAWRDETLNPTALVVQVGKTQLRYAIAAIDDLAAMLKARGDWIALGGAELERLPRNSRMRAV